MTTFWIITAAMILAALALLAPTLLRQRQAPDKDRNRQNIVIARERLAELEAEKQRGDVSEAQFQQTSSELELALLQDLGDEADEHRVRESRGAGRLGLALVAVLVPAITLGLYAFQGSPNLIDGVAQQPMAHGAGGSDELPSVEQMLDALVARLKETPEDQDGWFLLGRTYMAMNDYGKAVGAFERLNQLVVDQPVAMLAWADALAMNQRGNLAGKPTELVRRVLQLAPDNTTALWLGGMAEQQAGNPQQAVVLWERLLPQLQDDPESKRRIESLLATARQEAGGVAAGAQPDMVAPSPAEQPATGATQGIRVRVEVAAEFLHEVGPEEVLFIYARALTGPKMPLAAARHKVKDLPLELTLDDSSAMLPAMKLSNFEQVVVGARISRSGDPVAKSGDLRGEISPVATGSAVDIVIDSVVP